MVETGSEPVSNQGAFGTGPELVPEIGETGIEPPLVFEKDVDDSFDRVADFEKDKEVEIPILAVQPTTLKVPQTSEGQKKKQIKIPAGRTDLPLVRQFKAMQGKASSSPSQSKFAKPKPAPKPSIKSFCLASQSFSRTLKKTGSSKQSLPLVEEIVSSPESSPVRDSRNTPGEQGSPQTLVVSKGKAPAEPTSEPTLSSFMKSVAKRKVSPKQPFTQGPAERSSLCLLYTSDAADE